MNSEVKVSVYCLAYNHDKYIEKTLEGFVKQKTNFKFEVIIHDDASTDNTRSIIEKYVNKYPNILIPIYEDVNTYSINPDIMFNKIDPFLKGKYIASCEGDDYWIDEYKLQKQYDAMEANPNCSICVHSVARIDESGKPLGTYIPDKHYKVNKTGEILQDDVAKLLFSYSSNPFQPSSCFYRKDMLVKDELPKNARDIHVLRELLRNGSYYYINDVMSAYRIRESGNWTSSIKKLDCSSYVDFLIDELKEEINFDKKANERWHNIIYEDIKNTLLDIYAYYDKEKAINFVHEYNISFSINEKMRTNNHLFKEKIKKLICYDKLKRRIKKSIDV